MLALFALFVGQLIFYGIVIALLSKIFGRWRRLSRINILLAFIAVGLISGLFAAWLWPTLDSAAYPNMAAFLLGEEIYGWATSQVAPGTASPHEAIAWPLRVPQVFALASTVVFGILGLLIQIAYNQRINLKGDKDEN